MGRGATSSCSVARAMLRSLSRQEGGNEAASVPRSRSAPVPWLGELDPLVQRPVTVGAEDRLPAGDDSVREDVVDLVRQVLAPAQAVAQDVGGALVDLVVVVVPVA